MQERNDFFSLNFELDCKMTGHKAPDILCAKGREKEVVGLSKLVTDKPVVIYKYSDLNCNTCYEEGLKELQEVMGNFPESVKIVCSYKAEKDFLIFRKINRIKFDIYRIPHDSFGWTMEDYNTPYYFVLHPDMKISNIYVPNKSYPEMNKAYLESIKRFLVD
jgi:peroxiredoxin